MGTPEEAVTPAKRRRRHPIASAAEYLAVRDLERRPFRIDV